MLSKKRTRIQTASLSLSGLALLMALLINCSQGETPQARSSGGGAPLLPVEAVIIQPQLLQNKIYSTGTLLANEEVELRPEISGRVTGVFFDEGRRVKKGELMLKINDRELQAELKRKELEEKLAADEEGRRRNLLEIKGISQEEYDRSLNSLRVIQAEREVILSQIAKTEIFAPFDGVVGLRYVSEGGYASPNMLAATMQDIDPMKVEFSVPEKYASQLKSGTTIILEVGDQQIPHQGVIYAVESKIDPGTRTIKARARTSNPAGALIPGSFAKVEITLAEIPDAIVIPSAAIIPELAGEKVFVCVDGKAKAVPVRTGIRTDRTIQITEGLSPNDTLIVTGLLQLANGRGVKISTFQSN